MSNLFNVPELTRNQKLKLSKAETAKLTAFAINFLNDSQQFKAYRSNNTPSTRIARTPVVVNAFDKDGKPIEIKYDKVEIFFKKGNIKETVLDITGLVFPYDNGRENNFVWSGKHLEIEVKKGRDTLSPEQATRIKELKSAGAISFVFDSEETFLIQIKPFMVSTRLAF